MSKIQSCADLLIEIITYSSKDEQIRIESKLNSVMEAMAIFLDNDDVADILEQRVLPHLLPMKKKIWSEYLNNNIENLRNSNS